MNLASNPDAPLVSIALPFYNARATLRQTLESILRQTFSRYEVLLLDDGSSDGGLDVAREFADPRIRVLADGVNRGLAPRLNECVRLARGRYLARMDADDLMHPRRLERQVAELEAHPEIDVLGTDAWAIDPRGRSLGPYAGTDASRDPWTVVRRGLFIHPSVMGRTEWFRAHPYPEDCVRAEDHELWTRSCAESNFQVLHEPLLLYRLRSPWDTRAEIASARAVDGLILHWGERLGRLAEAQQCIRQRRLQRVWWNLGARLGLRWLKWQWKLRRYSALPNVGSGCDVKCQSVGTSGETQ